MNVVAFKAYNSASSFAIGQSIGQKITVTSRVDIPFPVAENQNEVLENSIAVGTAMADAMHALVMREEASIEPVAPYESGAVIERTALTSAIEIISNVVEKRNSIPILSNARMIARKGGLAVTATDLDMEITVQVAGAIDEDFAATLPANLLSKLLKKASKSDYVEITAHEAHAVLDFERVDYKLQTLPVADFPTLAAVSSNHGFALDGRMFWNAIDATMGAISMEETRYYLNGIFFHSQEVEGVTTLTMAATDGHRLYRQDMTAPDGCEGMPGVIIPRKTVELFHKLAKGKACPSVVEVKVSESKISIEFDNVSIVSKVIDGTFPDYHRVIPCHNDKLATLSAAAMLEAVGSVSLISSERGRAVKLSFSAGNCRLTVNNPDSGSATADVDCAYDGDDMEIGFNAKYLEEIIIEAAAGNGTFKMELSDSGSPARFTGDRAQWMGVSMPMRI